MLAVGASPSLDAIVLDRSLSYVVLFNALISLSRPIGSPAKPEDESSPASSTFRASSGSTRLDPLEAAKLITPVDEGDAVGVPQGSRLPRSTRQRLFSGWRFGVTLCAGTAIVVFFINAIVTIWVAANPRFPMRNGLGLLYRGSCSTSKRATIWLHLAINILCC